MSFNKKIETVLAEYHQRIIAEETLMKSLTRADGMNRRDDFLLPVGKEVGQFLYTLAKSAETKIILEIGTSYGYSTVWLAAAAKATGGKVITLEIDEQKANYAKLQIEKAGLSDFVEFRVGDALQSIRQAKEHFDFVLVDIWKRFYLPSFELFLPKLNNGAYVIGDNMIHPPNYKKEVNEYRAAIRATKAFDTVLLPIGSGIEVSLFKK
ncbi:MAG: O-methyltransferase [Saprospiraceae bacterium]